MLRNRESITLIEREDSEDGISSSGKEDSHEGAHFDLFYGLVFVVAIGLLAKDFSDPSGSSGELDGLGLRLLDFLALWTPLFFQWLFWQLYVNRYFKNDIWTMACYFLNFISIVGVSLNVSVCASHNYQSYIGNTIDVCVLISFFLITGQKPLKCRGFIIAYLIGRVVVVVCYIRAAIMHRGARTHMIWVAVTTGILIIPCWGLFIIFQDISVAASLALWYTIFLFSILMCGWVCCIEIAVIRNRILAHCINLHTSPHTSSYYYTH